MQKIIVQVPDDAHDAFRVAPEELGEALVLAAAVKLYEAGYLSSGAAAELAGVSKPEFLHRLSDYEAETFRETGRALSRETGLA